MKNTTKKIVLEIEYFGTISEENILRNIKSHFTHSAQIVSIKPIIEYREVESQGKDK